MKWKAGGRWRTTYYLQAIKAESNPRDVEADAAEKDREADYSLRGRIRGL